MAASQSDAVVDIERTIRQIGGVQQLDRRLDQDEMKFIAKKVLHDLHEGQRSSSRRQLVVWTVLCLVAVAALLMAWRSLEQQIAAHEMDNWQTTSIHAVPRKPR